MLNPLCIVFFEKTLFKTRFVNHRLSLLSDFIFDIESKRIIKSRYGIDSNLYKDILRRVKNYEDIPYLFDIVRDDISSTETIYIRNYLRYKYDKRVKR